MLVEPRRALSDAQIALTAEAIAARQRPDGRLPWHTDQHTDPWNHVEGAMGLTVGGRYADAERAYEWMSVAQRADGSWGQSYAWNGSIEDPDADTNMCAYIASGTLHHYLHTGDKGFLHELWPVVERAIEFVLLHQEPGGEIAWNHHADGTIDHRALLTASSSIFMSLRCAVALAELMGAERPDWELAIGQLAHAVRHRPHAFWPKPEWSMDWYYPVLTGITRGRAATSRIDRSWNTFFVLGRGCRCMADKPWVTTAETCELALALDAAGDTQAAQRLFDDIQFLRQDDGSYQEGWVFPDDVYWPGRTPPWTAGAVLLCAEALGRTSPAWDLFHGDRLPAGLDTDGVDVEPASDAAQHTQAAG